MPDKQNKKQTTDLSSQERHERLNEQFRRYRESHDIEIRNQIVEENLNMVSYCARQYKGRGIDYEDLYQVGSMALISAVERFDPDRGFRFSSFAMPTIQGEIKKYFRDNGWVLNVPRRMKELASSINKVKPALTLEFGRAPTVQELALRLGEKEEDILRALESSVAYDALSLNEAYEDDDSNSGMKFEKYTAQDEQGYADIEDYEIIIRVLKSLSGTERFIFKRRFIEKKSQSEIAEELGVSQMTISRAQKKIMARFREETKVQ